MARSMNQGPRKKTAPVLPSSEELYGFLDPTTATYGIGLNDREQADFQRLLGKYDSGELKGRNVNPFQGLPVAVGTGTFEAVAIFEDDDESEYLTEDLTEVIFMTLTIIQTLHKKPVMITRLLQNFL